MNHTVLARSDVDKCAELQNSDDGTFENVADFGVFRDSENDGLCAFGAFDFLAGDKYHTVVADIDFDACFFDNLVDDLSAAADDVFNFIGVDVESDDFRRVFGKFLSRLGNAFRHFSENEQSALTGLFQSGAQNFLVDALDFNIHLNGGDAFGRTRNFKVHISEEIFEALYIAHNGDSARLVVLDKTHCDARYGSLDGNAGVFESHRAAAYARH